MESGDKPQTTAAQLRGEPMIVVKEKEWDDLRASDARRRALLEKHQWADWSVVHARRMCPECRNLKPAHATSCALAAELKEGG